MANISWQQRDIHFAEKWLVAHPGRAVAWIISISLMLAGCGTISSSDDTAEFWSPFNTQSSWEVGDGRIHVELSGFERGHEPGKPAEFNVSIENRREQPAEIDVCAKLIDERQIIQRFEVFSMTIGPDGSDSATFTATLDEEIEPRAYGLAVVIDDIGAVIHTVRVGIPDDEAGPWLDADELVCDS